MARLCFIKWASIQFQGLKSCFRTYCIKKKWREDKRMIYLRLALYEKLLRLIDGTGHGYLLYYSIHFCACLQFSIVIHLKSSFSVKAESSPATQFESINSSVLSLLYGPTLTPICYYWKNHSFWVYGLSYMVWVYGLLAKWCLLLFNMLSMFVVAFQGASIF